MKRSGDSSGKPITVNPWDLIPPDTGTEFPIENTMTWRPSTPYPGSTPKKFPRGSRWHAFFEIDKTCVNIFFVLRRYFDYVLESGNLACSATAGTKTALGILCFWFNYFAASRFKALDKPFPGRLRRDISPLVSAPVSLLVCAVKIELQQCQWRQCLP